MLLNSYNLSLHDYYISVLKDNTLIFYKGAFDEKIISEVSQNIRRFAVGSSVVGKKLFSIFIELAQNIAFYSAERNIINNKLHGSGVGLIIIHEYSEHYTVKTGNLVGNKDSIKLAHKCSAINSLNRDGLRQLKRRQRNQPSVNKDSGNIGLIQVALLGNSPLRMNLQNVDDNYSFFSLEIDVLKNAYIEDES
jgi:hypothetical protein